MSEQEPAAGHEHASVTIVINGTAHEVAKGKISYAEVVALAFPTPANDPNTVYSITYRHGQGAEKGILSDGEAVEVTKKMVFNVTQTTRS